MAANVVTIAIKAQDQASAKIDSITGKLKVGLPIAGAAGAAALAGIGVAAFNMARSFETAFAEVTTLFDAPKEQVAELRQGVLDLSKEMGVNATEATKALYQAISAGVAPDNALAFLNENVKLAIGGVTELSTAVDLTTTVMNAFGLAEKDLTRINDTLFTTVRLGKTTVDELGGAMFNVAPVAAAAGVSIEEVGAALAVLTASGVQTSVATTQLRQALLSMIAPTTRQRTQMDELGVSMGKDVLAAEGLEGAFRLLMEQTGGNEEVLRKLLGSTEAVQAALVLGGTGAESFASGIAAMGNKAGATDDAFQKMNDTVDRQLKIAINELNVELTELALKTLPAAIEGIKIFSTTVGTSIDLIEEYNDELKAAAAAANPLIAALDVLSLKWEDVFGDMPGVVQTAMIAVAGLIDDMVNAVLGGIDKILSGIDSFIEKVNTIPGLTFGKLGPLGLESNLAGALSASLDAAFARGVIGNIETLQDTAGQKIRDFFEKLEQDFGRIAATDDDPGGGRQLGETIGDNIIDGIETAFLDRPAVGPEELLRIMEFIQALDFTTIGDQLRFIRDLADEAGGAFDRALGTLSRLAGVSVRKLELRFGLVDELQELNTAARLVAEQLGLTVAEVLTSLSPTQIPTVGGNASALAGGGVGAPQLPAGIPAQAITQNITVNVEDRSPAAIAHAVEMAGLELGDQLAVEGL